jgi:hypothetical protein
MNNAARLWNGTAEEAIQVLRDEWLYIHASRAARLVGGDVKRAAQHERALRRVPGEYGMQIGILIAASPAASRARISEEFSKLLDVATAAEMRGTITGTWYLFRAWIDDQYEEKQILCDAQRARELAEKAEQDAISAGAQSVVVKFWEIPAGRRAA